MFRWSDLLQFAAIALPLLMLGIWLYSARPTKIGLAVGLCFGWLASLIPLFGLTGSIVVDVAGMEKADTDLLKRWIVHLSLFAIAFSIVSSLAARTYRHTVR